MVAVGKALGYAADMNFVCAAPSDYAKTVIHAGLAVAFGLAVEPIISTDYLKHVGRSHFFPFPGATKDYSDFTAGWANMTLYTAFLAANNPHLSKSELLKMRIKGIRKIPDLCTHDDPRRLEYYEIKANSEGGRRRGREKLAAIQAFNDYFSLPYKAGTIYSPDKKLTIWEGDLWVGHVITILHVMRISPGLIVYEICRNDPPGMARLGEIAIENLMCEIMLVWLGMKSLINVGEVLGANPTASGFHLNASVGRGGANGRNDVFLAQFMLNQSLYKTEATLLKVDGIAGPKTCGAIETVQRRLGMTCDGRIDKGGRTFSALADKFAPRLCRACRKYPCMRSSARHRQANMRTLGDLGHPRSFPILRRVRFYR